MRVQMPVQFFFTASLFSLIYFSLVRLDIVSFLKARALIRCERIITLVS